MGPLTLALVSIAYTSLLFGDFAGQVGAESAAQAIGNDASHSEAEAVWVVDLDHLVQRRYQHTGKSVDKSDCDNPAGFVGGGHLGPQSVDEPLGKRDGKHHG